MEMKLEGAWGWYCSGHGQYRGRTPRPRGDASPVSSSGSGAGRREVVIAEAAGSVPFRCCMHWPLRFQANTSLPIFPGESPGNVAAHVPQFHLQGGVARDTGKKLAFRVLQLTLTSSLDRISRPRHIPPFQWGTSFTFGGHRKVILIEATTHPTSRKVDITFNKCIYQCYSILAL